VGVRRFSSNASKQSLRATVVNRERREGLFFFFMKLLPSHVPFLRGSQRIWNGIALCQLCWVPDTESCVTCGRHTMDGCVGRVCI
jgi:hypothetical protein